MAYDRYLVIVLIALDRMVMQINYTIHSEQLAISITLITKSHMGAAPIFSVAI